MRTGLKYELPSEVFMNTTRSIPRVLLLWELWYEYGPELKACHTNGKAPFYKERKFMSDQVVFLSRFFASRVSGTTEGGSV